MRQAEARRVEWYRAEWMAVSATSPLPTGRARALLHELAGLGVPGQSVRALYRAAAARWHPDKPAGDTQVFQLLQEAHRIVRLMDSG